MNVPKNKARIAVIWLGLCLGAIAPQSIPADDYFSPLALAADPQGAAVYVAGHTGRKLARIDVAEGAIKRMVEIPDRPTGLALSSDGSRLYVTTDKPAGEVLIMDPNTDRIEGTVAVGHTPVAPVLSPDGKRLYVCNRFNNDVSVVDLATNEETERIAVTREPVAAAITPDGGWLLVANHLPAGPSDGDYVAAAVSIIDTAAEQVAATIQLPNGSSGLRGVCVSPDGKYAYVAHILARYQMPTTQVERGWMNTNALSVIDVPERRLVNTVLLDDVDLGAANPWGVTCTPDGKCVCVAHAGTHEVSVIDRAGLHEKLNKVAAGQGVSEVSATAADVPNDLAFLVGLRRRVVLGGNGPRGIVVIGRTLYAAEYFSDAVGVVDLDPASRRQAKSIPLGPRKRLSAARKGEMFFNDASLCFQHWQSCASCHPDGRADGLNWDLLNDGLGNPKNTKSLLLSHKTPPAMSLGLRDKAEAAVRAGIKSIQFAVRPEEDAAAIDAYCQSLEPVPSPYRAKGTPAAAKRGQRTFQQAGCASCHLAPLYTDGKSYDAGTGKEVDADRKFDTPTLVEVWRTAPYLHDGRAATMKELLTRHNPGDRHGVTTGLSEAELEDLAAFILAQ